MHEEASFHEETETVPSAPNVPASLDLVPRDQLSHDVSFSELSLGQELGRGSFSIAFQGTWHGIEVAVKCIRLPSGSTMGTGEDDTLLRKVFRDHVLPEVELLGAIRHPFVVECYGSH